MPQVLLVNPSPRKGASARKGVTRAKAQSRSKSTMATARKKPRSAAQKAATKKMIAANRARSRPARVAARKKPAARRAPARAAAPAKRRRTSARRGRGGWPITSTPTASKAGRALRYRRPNPIGGFVRDTLMPSVVGGAGALALDVAVAMLPLPPAMKTGPMAPLVKAAGAVGIGMLAGQFMGRRVGEQVAAGGLTVTMYNLARGVLSRASGGKIPGLSMYPDGMGAYVSEYIEEAPPQLGYESSGGQVGEAELQGYETGVYR